MYSPISLTCVHSEITESVLVQKWPLISSNATKLVMHRMDLLLIVLLVLIYCKV